MKITTLETSVAIPFELGSDTRPIDAAPLDVQHHVALGRPWHLIGWVDENEGLFGLSHKGRYSIATWPITKAAIGAMRPAKGRGYVALELSSSQPPSVMILCSSTYSEPLLQWLVSHQGVLSSVLGISTEIEDWGSDY